MAKIALKDLLTKTPEEILKQMKSGEESKISLSEEKTEDPKQDDGVRKSKVNRKVYIGLFSTDTVFEKGQVIQMHDHTLTVLNVEKSSGRVRFQHSCGEIFSLSISVLIPCKSGTFLFSKGDLIRFEGKEYTIVGLNPASKNIVINFEGKPRYLKISKVEKVHGPSSSEIQDQGVSAGISEPGQLSGDSTIPQS